MKKILFCTSLLLAMSAVNAQVGIGTATPHASAQLEISAANKGLLIPRVTQANRPASPTTGLLIYQTDNTPGFYYYDGISWKQLGAGGNSWTLDGNAGTTASHFIGTSDGQPLRFRANGQRSGLIEFTTTANTAFGNRALNSITSGASNAAYGYLALAQNLNGSENTAIGTEALSSNTAAHGNTAVGRFALSNNRANENTAVGKNANATNTFGENNIAIGNFTLPFNTVGRDNTAIGYNAGPNVDAVSNTTCIGNGARVSNSNRIRIGNTAINTIEGQVAFTNPSDKRFKFNIQENVKGLDFILKLRPVTYQFDSKLMDQFINGQKSNASYDPNMEKAFNEAVAIRRTGLIAQEVENAANETGYDFNGINKPKSEKDYYTLSYATLVVPLVKAIQEQQQMIDQLKKSNQNNELLKNENERLNKEVELLKQKEKTMADRLARIEALLKK